MPLKERINKTNAEPKQDNYNPNNPNTNIVSAHVRIIEEIILFCSECACVHLCTPSSMLRILCHVTKETSTSIS